MTEEKQEEVPDVLGEHGRMNMLIEMMRNLQQQEFEVETLQLINGVQDHVEIPGQPGVTFGDRLKQYREGQQRLLEKHPALQVHLDQMKREEQASNNGKEA